MRIFLDTEFTDLGVDPRLLSVGMVGSGRDPREFYAEVTDRERLHAASWFALDVVLPQFGKFAHASCSYATLGARVAAFFDRIVTSLGAREIVEVAFSDGRDWELTERAMLDCGAGPSVKARKALRPLNVHDVTGARAGRLAAEAYFTGQDAAVIQRHHALCDARALRRAYEAATSAELVCDSPPQKEAQTVGFVACAGRR